MDRRLYGDEASHVNVYATLQGLARAVLENGDVSEAGKLIRKSSSKILESGEKRMSRECRCCGSSQVGRHWILVHRKVQYNFSVNPFLRFDLSMGQIIMLTFLLYFKDLPVHYSR